MAVVFFGYAKIVCMKETNKSNIEKEPTITEVVVAIQDLTEAVQAGFARHEEILGHHDKLLNTLVTGQENLTERINVVDQRLSATQNRVEDVAEMLEDMTEVVDENRDVLFKHEERITILEKIAA